MNLVVQYNFSRQNTKELQINIEDGYQRKVDGGNKCEIYQNQNVTVDVRYD